MAHALFGNNFIRMEHCAVNLGLQNRRHSQHFSDTQTDQKRRRRIRDKMDNLLIPSTFNTLSLVAVKGWLGLGSLLSAIFLKRHDSEHRYDFQCLYVKGNIDKDFVRGTCFDQYQKQNNKLGVPLYAFIMVNVLVIPVVSVIYSQCVKSIVRELERRHQDAERRRGRRLFLAYIFQLAVSCFHRPHKN